MNIQQKEIITGVAFILGFCTITLLTAIIVSNFAGQGFGLLAGMSAAAVYSYAAMYFNLKD
jgi:hypothetical protein